MLAPLRSRVLSGAPSPPCPIHPPWRQLGFLLRLASTSTSSSSSAKEKQGILDLAEVEKVLSDVKADDVRVIPVRDQCDWTDYMVIATGRSTWHVRNIAQALIHKVKQKQKGAERMLLPSVEGHGGGKWVVIDSGTVIVHALDEKARAYYNLESLWTAEISPKGPNQDLEKAIVKTRRRNNSKKPMKSVQ
ncbi:protein Iojap-related, mitochondrial isoform X2 [Elaeis guineensis]|uniref:Protein Iojap-related, mitochondrial isoform X2 n=1 Tax=Elaeis guineensis var. tenera TaxID=51953 RepID=A0A6I9QRB5_ELAGV|nr:protein Iojap-related, mitochondrial isoform X2 [Elaeis guineensis]